MIRSNVREIIDQHQYLFETLWNKAILGEQKIQEIENGILPERIEILYDAAEAQKLGYDLIRSSEKEILIVLSASNAFLRQIKAEGVNLVLEAASRNVAITILTPMDEYDLIFMKGGFPKESVRGIYCDMFAEVIVRNLGVY